MEKHCSAIKRGAPVAKLAKASPKRTGLWLSDEELLHQFFERFGGVAFKGSKKTTMGWCQHWGGGGIPRIYWHKQWQRPRLEVVGWLGRQKRPCLYSLGEACTLYAVWLWCQLLGRIAAFATIVSIAVLHTLCAHTCVLVKTHWLMPTFLSVLSPWQDGQG